MRKDKKQAIKLRKLGYSYNDISSKLKVPKSTLSGWFKQIKSSQIITSRNIIKAKIKWADNIISYNKKRAQEARSNWVVRQKMAAKEIRKVTQRELKLVGSALYWAEGYKKGNWNIVFCNSDPAMIKLMTKFFLNVCEIPVSKIKVQIQIYPQISKKSATEYWSRITKLPKSHFLKPISQVSKRSQSIRKNNLPFGTLRIKINDVKLVNKIKGWIAGISKA